MEPQKLIKPGPFQEAPKATPSRFVTRALHTVLTATNSLHLVGHCWLRDKIGEMKSCRRSRYPALLNTPVLEETLAFQPWYKYGCMQRRFMLSSCAAGPSKKWRSRKQCCCRASYYGTYSRDVNAVPGTSLAKTPCASTHLLNETWEKRLTSRAIVHLRNLLLLLGTPSPGASQPKTLRKPGIETSPSWGV